MEARSIQVLRLMAEMMPIGMPITSQIDGGAERQHDADGQALLHELPDRDVAAVGEVDLGVHPPPAAGHEALREPAVLHEHRPVETEGVARGLDLLGAGAAPAGGSPGGIARRKLDEDEERDDRDDPEHQQQEQDPPDQVSAHAHLTSLGGGVRRARPFERPEGPLPSGSGPSHRCVRLPRPHCWSAAMAIWSKAATPANWSKE